MKKDNPLLHSVLIVDDNQDARDLLRNDISDIAKVILCENVAIAKEKFLKNNFAVVISDLNMPDESGIDFLSFCAEKNPNSQRILLTAFSDLIDIEKSINSARLNTLLSKPWNKIEIQTVVTNAIRQHSVEEENQLLRKVALSDALTGLSNHRCFWERLEAEFSRAKRFKRPLSLIMCDIDNFKKVNDEHGHQEGDRLLREVAQTLENGRRSMDTVARYGGEEFAIVLPEASHDNSLEIAKRHLGECIKRTKISLSMGVASFPEHTTTPTELVFKADQALLAAKKRGKSQVLSINDL